MVINQPNSGAKQDHYSKHWFLKRHAGEGNFQLQRYSIRNYLIGWYIVRILRHGNEPLESSNTMMYRCRSPQGDWAVLWIHFTNVLRESFLDVLIKCKHWELYCMPITVFNPTQIHTLQTSLIYICCRLRRQEETWPQGAHSEPVVFWGSLKQPFRNGYLGCGYRKRRVLLCESFQQSHPIDRRLSQNVGHLFDHRKDGQNCKSWHEFLSFGENKSVKISGNSSSHSPELLGPCLPSRKEGNLEMHPHSSLKGVRIISTAKGKTGYFNSNSHVEMGFTLATFYSLYYMTLIECICDHGLWNQIF